MICFGHENLRVSDLEASIRFYETQLGMTVRKRLPNDEDGPMAWLSYGTEPFFLELTQAAVVRGADHIAFVTDEMEKYHAMHCAAGLIDRELSDLDIYFMHDPDGNSIEIMSVSAMAALNGQDG